MAINRNLFDLARRQHVKQAFVPSEAAAQSGGPPPGGSGPPPGDPGMAPGGGGPPPMDPGMGGGGPPPGGDPMGGGGGGMPPMPSGGGLGDIDAKVQQAVQSALQASGMQGNAGSPKQPKPDINTVATDLFQLKKMFLAYLRRQGIELPPDILDGPNRDPATGAPAVSPTGGSDVQPGAAQATAAGAIQPISPIQPAMINAISGGGKQASARSPGEIKAYLLKEASDVLRCYALVCEREALAEDIWAADQSEKAAGDQNIYAASGGPGESYPAPARRATSKAAAIASVFRKRRQPV